MTSTITCLPVLDGTHAAAVARLDAWSRTGKAHPVDTGLAKIKSHLDEAACILPGLASMEECDAETCTKAGDLEYLASELKGAVTAVETVKQAVVDGRLGGAA